LHGRLSVVDSYVAIVINRTAIIVNE
jgi:hypothetical protein